MLSAPSALIGTAISGVSGMIGTLLGLGYCWSIGKLDDYIPEPVKSTHIFPAAAK